MRIRLPFGAQSALPIAVCCLACVSFGCGADTAASVTQPTAVAAPSTGMHAELSGTVLDRTSGVQPVRGGQVSFWIGNGRWGQVPVDGEGRYTVPSLPPGTLVRLLWTPLPGYAGLLQPHPVNVETLAGQVTRDIDVMRRGTTPSSRPLTLSGVVYKETADGRRPLARQRVLYSINNWPGLDAYTETNEFGAYHLFGLPSGTGRLGIGDCNDAVLPVDVAMNRDAVQDVDLTSFLAACPGVPTP